MNPPRNSLLDPEHLRTNNHASPLLSSQADSPESHCLATERLQLWLKLLRVHKALRKVLQDSFRSEFDTTINRFDIMATLSHRPEGLNLNALSQSLKIPSDSLNAIIDQLVQEGLVVWESILASKRIFLLKLTRSGRASFTLQAQAHRVWVNDMLDFLSEQDLQQLNHQLADVLENLREKNIRI